MSAISDTGKSVIPEHLLLLANALSISGEFVGLNSRGISLQRQHTSVLSPFQRACFTVSSHLHYNVITEMNSNLLKLIFFRALVIVLSERLRKKARMISEGV